MVLMHIENIKCVYSAHIQNFLDVFVESSNANKKTSEQQKQQRTNSNKTKQNTRAKKNSINSIRFKKLASK